MFLIIQNNCKIRLFCVVFIQNDQFPEIIQIYAFMRNLVDLVFCENAPAIITWLIIIIMIIVESHILRVILMHRYHSVSKKRRRHKHWKPRAHKMSRGRFLMCGTVKPVFDSGCSLMPSKYPKARPALSCSISRVSQACQLLCGKSLSDK